MQLRLQSRTFEPQGRMIRSLTEWAENGLKPEDIPSRFVEIVSRAFIHVPIEANIKRLDAIKSVEGRVREDENVQLEYEQALRDQYEPAKAWLLDLIFGDDSVDNNKFELGGVSDMYETGAKLPSGRTSIPAVVLCGYW